MKKWLLIIFLCITVAAGYTLWQILIRPLNPPDKGYFYVPTNTKMPDLKSSLLNQQIVKNSFFLNQVIKYGKFKNPRAGRYKISHSMSLMDLIKDLKRGNQTSIKLVITKLRTKEDLAGKIGRQFEADSLQVIHFLLNNDSLKKYETDTNTVMTLIIPNTYELYWNGSFSRILNRLKVEHDKFWTNERKEKATAHGLTIGEVYTMASIVEEETNILSDKPLIASVYINRLKKGMKLEADPTVKYASRNFGLTRILHGHLKFPSPYNTYYKAGLPPGPICTPSQQTIDAVLNAPQTKYLFFVAKPDFSGYSNFAINYEEHKRFAKSYRQALDSLIISKQRQ
ncbi:MAG: endolytic transglycosylase MltG [Ferruginibacter sp.]|nr:endolytic transglycosylase MltG [Ferruginibacter sp.]